MMVMSCSVNLWGFLGAVAEKGSAFCWVGGRRLRRDVRSLNWDRRVWMFGWMWLCYVCLAHRALMDVNISNDGRKTVQYQFSNQFFPLDQPFVNFVEVEDVVTWKHPHLVSFGKFAEAYRTFKLSFEPGPEGWVLDRVGS